MRRIITCSILAAILVALTACGTSRTPSPGAPGPDATPVQPLPDTTPDEPIDREPPMEPPTGDPDTDPDRIYADVRSALDRSTELDASEVEIWVDRGTVYLSGWVRTPAERTAALATAEGVPGVTRVYSSGLQVRE